MNKKDSFETKGQPSRYSLRKEQNDAYRSRILRFTLQFSLKDSVVRSWFEQQEDKGAYLKNLMLDDMLKQTNLGFDEIQAAQKESNRTAGDYQIIHAFHVGDKEIVIGENPKATGDERYMCAYCQRNEIFEQYFDVMVSDDFCEIAKLYADRLSEQAEKTRAVTFKPVFQGIDTTPLTEADCAVITHMDDIHDKIVVIKPNVLRREYRMATHQIKLCTGGFGASPNSRGSACFCVDLYSGRHSRFERRDILGTLTADQLPQWAALGLDQYRNEQRQNSHKDKEER